MCFCLAEVDDRRGYLLVTSDRIVVFCQTSFTGHEKVLEVSLDALSKVSVQGPRFKRHLELYGSEFRYLVRGVPRTEVERIGHYLRTRLPTSLATLPGPPPSPDN